MDPNPTPSPIDAADSSGRTRAVLSLVSTILAFWLLVGLALLLRPELLQLAPVPESLRRLPPSMVRMLAFGDVVGNLVALSVIQIVYLGTTRGNVWGAFADRTGGTFTQERRTLSAGAWVGGPTIRWTIRGVPVVMSGFYERSRNNVTRLSAEFTMARPFEFAAMRENAVTRMLASPKVWSFVLRSLKPAQGLADAAIREEAMRTMSIMARPDVSTGLEDFDRSVLLRSSDESMARDLFLGSGMAEAVRELQARSATWNFTLSPTGSGTHRLAIDTTGTSTRPEILQAMYALMDASLGALRFRGALAA